MLVYRVLSYAAGQGQNAQTIAGGATITASPAITSIKAGHCGISGFVHQGNAGDGMSDAEHTWLDECVEGDQDHYSSPAGSTIATGASKDDAAANASWAQKDTFVTTLGYGGCLASAVWENI